MSTDTEYRAVDILHAQCAGISSRADGSIAMRFVTPELLSSEAGYCVKLHGKNVRLTVIPEDVEPAGMTTVTTEREEKTPSQILRGIIFSHYSQANKPGGNWDAFYRKQMTAISEGYKAKNPV